MHSHRMTPLQLLGITFMITLLNMNVMAFYTCSDSSVVLKYKVYLDDKPANFDVADSVYIDIVEINSPNQSEHLEESGIFNMNLGFGKHFLIYVSRVGYETQFFEFSTIGVEPEMNLMLYLDITLSQEMDLDNGPTIYSSNKLKYNNLEKDQYINMSQGTLITFDTNDTN